MNSLKTLAAKQASLASGTATSRELVEASLAAATDPSGEGARTFRRIYVGLAGQAADAIDKQHQYGISARPLLGIPISVKDLFDVAVDRLDGLQDVLQALAAFCSLWGFILWCHCGRTTHPEYLSFSVHLSGGSWREDSPAPQGESGGRSHIFVGFGDSLVGRVKVNARCPECPVAHLFLNDGKRQLVNMDVTHEVAVAKTMDRDLMEPSSEGISPILAV